MERVRGGIARPPGIAHDDVAAAAAQKKGGAEAGRPPANDDDIEHADGGAKGSPRLCPIRTCLKTGQRVVRVGSIYQLS
jgi:hypothetical protein